MADIRYSVTKSFDLGALLAAAPTLLTALAQEHARRVKQDEVVERLQYVLGGVAAAIDTGRNEPLKIWREQIDIARAALKETGHET